MTDPQVIACFVIYSDGGIVHQGSFQVETEHATYSFASKDGGVFNFSHSYQGAHCSIGVSYTQSGSVVAEKELVVPINRTKKKWKQCPLGAAYVIHYRCAFEHWFGPKQTKEFRKMRRKAMVATASTRSQDARVNFFRSKESSDSGDA